MCSAVLTVFCEAKGHSFRLLHFGCILLCIFQANPITRKSPSKCLGLKIKCLLFSWTAFAAP